MNPRKMAPVLAMLLIVLCAGCKKDSDNGILPTVTSTTPINKATGMEISSKVSATFSLTMDPSSISTSRFTLQQGDAMVAGVVNCAGTTATFTPATNLAPGVTYTATVMTGVKAMDGKSLAKDYVWSFTTGAIPDSSVPTVTLSVPANNATGVGLAQKIVTTFSEAMAPASITASTFTLKQGSTVVPGAITYTGTTATFTPTSNLTAEKIYTITITTGVKDLAGNQLAANFNSSFTTGNQDNIPPSVALISPANNATGVGLGQQIIATFSEAMTPATITAATIMIKQGSTSVSGTITYTGTTATVTPANNLTASTVYSVTITTGVKDLAGNPLATNFSSSFTTGTGGADVIPPTVTSTNPLSDAMDVSRNGSVQVTFSEAMDPTTVTSSSLTLQHSGIGVSGNVTYSGITAVFVPSAALDPATTYTATMSGVAKDLAGNALGADTYWYFTTGNTIIPLAPVDLGTAGNYLILAKTEITNIATSNLTGDLALSPAATSYITGFALTNATGYATSSQVTGNIYAADMAAPTPVNLTAAVNNMLTAYNDAAGRPTPQFLELGTGNIGGTTLSPGLYKWTTSVTAPSDVTISGGPNDIWIFQISGDLTLSSAIQVTLSGGADAKNIFWQVAGTVSVGTTAHMEGIILSMTGVTFLTGASLHGRALAQTAVILDGNTMTQP